MNYEIRIQGLNGYDEKIIKVFSSERFFKTIRITCNNSNTKYKPYYILLVTCNYKQPALRQLLKKHFNSSSGKEHVSIKNWDGNLNTVYKLFGENVKLDMIRSIERDAIERVQRFNKSVADKVTTEQSVTETCFTKHILEPSDEYIFHCIMDIIRNTNEQFLNKTEMENLIVRIQANVRDDNSWEKYKNNLYIKYKN